MNKTALKIIVYFTLFSAVTAILVMGMNFISISILASDAENRIPHTPQYALKSIEENLKKGDSGFYLEDERSVPDGDWCILISEDGDVIWQHKKPVDVPTFYKISDIAKMTRWFLNDYPVYLRCGEYGILVLGLPKNAVGKYSIDYSMNWFGTLPSRITRILAANLILAFFFAAIIGVGLYKKLKLLTNGISDMRLEKNVRLPEKGIFKEISRNINDTSECIIRKNEALKIRDSARSNWVGGISHDIRTPLSIIMGYAETIAKDDGLSEPNRKKAEIIKEKSVKIKKLIEDLNLISSLEYDMQPNQKKPMAICPLLRVIVSDIINDGLDEKYSIELFTEDESAVVMCDESLLWRAYFNIIQNSMTHNKDGCRIVIKEYSKGGFVFVEISDDGSGVDESVIRNMNTIPMSMHGLGLHMAYKIFKVHGWKMEAKNDNGFKVITKLKSQ